MIHLKKYLLVFIVVLLSCGICWADIYQWEDEDGVIHFTDTPPGDASEWEEYGEDDSG